MTESELPDIETLRHRCRRLALLDAIFCPKESYRYYRFDPAFGPGEQMASMRNGQGDDWFIVFTPAGALIRGLDREAAAPARRDAPEDEAWRRLPSAFAAFIDRPALVRRHGAYCFWRHTGDAGWSKLALSPASLKSPGEDGSGWMLGLLIEGADAFRDYAADYYLATVPVSAIEQVYAGAPLTEDIVRALNPKTSFAQAQAFASEVGYP